jgi:MFS-type transporter involved in bile tolerance (Atg22 family)
MEQAIIAWSLTYLAILIVTLVVWVGTLVHQAKNSRWIWFVLTLIGIPFSIILYWIVWLFSSKKKGKKKKRR